MDFLTHTVMQRLAKKAREQGREDIAREIEKKEARMVIESTRQKNPQLAKKMERQYRSHFGERYKRSRPANNKHSSKKPDTAEKIAKVAVSSDSPLAREVLSRVLKKSPEGEISLQKAKIDKAIVKSAKEKDLRSVLTLTKAKANLDRKLKEIRSLRRAGYDIKRTDKGWVAEKRNRTDERISRMANAYRSIDASAAKGNVKSLLSSGMRNVSAPFLSFDVLAERIKRPFLLLFNPKEARKSYEKELRTLAEYRYKFKTGSLSEKTTMVLSSPIGVFGTSVLGGAATSGAMGTLSAVAPKAASITGNVMKGVGYGVVAYSGVDVSRDLFKGNYDTALKKSLQYGVTFLGFGIGAKSGSFERGYELGRRAWTSRHPSSSITIIESIEPAEKGVVVKGKHFSVGRRSLGTSTVTEADFAAVVDNEGIHITSVKGKVDVYGAKGFGRRMRWRKISTEELIGAFRGEEANLIKVNLTKKGWQITEITKIPGKGKFAEWTGRIQYGKFGLRESDVFIRESLSDSFTLQKGAGYTRIGKRRFLSSAESIGKREDFITRHATRGLSFTPEGKFADYIHEYGVIIDTTATGEGIGKFKIRGVAAEGGEGMKPLDLGGQKQAVDYQKFVQRVYKGLLNVTSATPSFVSRIPISVPFAVAGIEIVKMKNRQINMPDVITGSRRVTSPISLESFVSKEMSYQSTHNINIVDTGEKNIFDVTNFSGVDTYTTQSTENISNVVDLPAYDLIQESFRPSGKHKRIVPDFKESTILPEIPEFDVRFIGFDVSKLLEKGYRYRKWKVMKIEDLLFGR